MRSMAGTGAVLTSAGLVFAFTMAAMLGSDLTVLGQFGSTVCIGLLLDTLVVRTLFMPSLATMLGRWFGWPLVVHPRGEYANPKLPPVPSTEEDNTAPLAGQAQREARHPAPSPPTAQRAAPPR